MASFSLFVALRNKCRGGTVAQKVTDTSMAQKLLQYNLSKFGFCKK